MCVLCVSYIVCMHDTEVSVLVELFIILQLSNNNKYLPNGLLSDQNKNVL